MKLHAISSSLLLAASTANASSLQKRQGTIVNAKTPPVTVKGNAFFTGNTRFFVRGIAWQPGGASNLLDPISDIETCKRDVPKFKDLGVNVVRVYTIDNSKNHDDCMKLLADAGIYLALDVNSPLYSLNRANDWSVKASYNDVYLQSVFATVDIFAKYDNTLLFYSANEVIHDDASTFTAPYIKAVTRDIKAYLKARNYRKIPVGYSAADVSENRYETATYMDCGGDDARSDFFGFNDYSWCSSDIKTSGWDKKVEQYKDYPVPIFLSEFGCNEAPPRTWAEFGALMSPAMTSVYSGGIAYEYTQEANNYGVVDVKGGAVTERPDFGRLKSALAKYTIPKDASGFKENGKASACPKQSKNWNVANNTLPLMPKQAQKYLQNGAGKGPGIPSGGKGSQWAGTPTEGWAEAGSSGSSGSTGSSKTGAGSATRPGYLAGVAVMAAAMGLM